VRTHSGTSRTSLAVFATVLILVPLLCSQADAVRRSKSDRDINAIGHRNIVHGDERKFIGSPEKEKRLGAQFFSAFERSAKLITDSSINNYLSELAQKIERNSDAGMPITVVVVDDNAVNACTSPGGYQYITRGLLAHTESEGELAAVLAHGIAETALHVPTRQALRHALLSIAVPTAFSTASAFTCTSLSSSPLASGASPSHEFDADYFGIQYLYQSGYDPQCYLRFVQWVWPSAPGSKNVALSLFPPTDERLKTLRKEITDILPQRGKTTGSTSAFEEFQHHLHDLPSAPPEPDKPVLRPASDE